MNRSEAEILYMIICGTALGVSTAVVIHLSGFARRFVRPVVIASQALPVFAIAPLLVVWFGTGMTSKVVMASLIIYFPIASALTDGMERTESGLVDLSRIYGASKWQSLMLVRLPAALPSLASGLRVAATIAPIGAIVGEWVGSAAGLGYVMIQANARTQVDTVFAALIILALIAIFVRLAVDWLLDATIHWVPKTSTT